MRRRIRMTVLAMAVAVAGLFAYAQQTVAEQQVQCCFWGETCYIYYSALGCWLAGGVPLRQGQHCLINCGLF